MLILVKFLLYSRIHASIFIKLFLKNSLGNCFSSISYKKNKYQIYKNIFSQLHNKRKFKLCNRGYKIILHKKKKIVVYRHNSNKFS